MKIYRDKPQLKKTTKAHKGQYLHYASSNMCGWRSYDEDAHLCEISISQDQEISLFGIFDGHCGPQISQYAQMHFVQTLLQNGYFLTKNYERALIQTFLQLDKKMKTEEGKKQILRIRQQNVIKNNASNYQGNSIAGSTANVVLIAKQFIYCANVGDSQSIAILKQSKVSKPKCKALNVCHKPEQQYQKKRIQKAGGYVEGGRVNGNLNLSRALGDFRYKNNSDKGDEQQIIIAVPEVVKIVRKEIKYIIMGCDGIWQTKSNEKMTKFIHKKVQSNKNKLQEIVEALIDQHVSENCDSDFGMDNMTAIMISLVN